MTNKRSITARLAPTRKAKLEALADVYYQGAQADVIRRWIDEQYDLVFGNLDPRGLLDGRVSDDTAHTLMGDTQTDTDALLEELDVDDELRLEEDEQLPATAQDGGTLTHQPERFETMLGPQEVATSGPALEWEEFRKIVADDGHWSETLAIHPDRVPENALKSNHKLASRVLAAMARHKAHDEEIQLAGCTEQVIDPGELAVTVPEQYADLRIWLLKTVQQLLERFVQEIPESHREAVLTHHTPTAVEETIRPLIE